MPINDFYFDYYDNAMWYVLVTMTTGSVFYVVNIYFVLVGYGDYFVRTIPGRLIAFFICIWGVFVISMMVITLTNLLNMDSLESKVYTSKFKYTNVLGV